MKYLFLLLLVDVEVERKYRHEQISRSSFLREAAALPQGMQKGGGFSPQMFGERYQLGTHI